MKSQSKGFSVVELLIVVIFIGVLAAIAVPRLNFAAITKQKADTVARKMVTDLRRTRTLAISDAANNTQGYRLDMTGSSPYAGYTIENIDTSAVIDTHTISSDIACTGGSAFDFGPLGNLQSASTQLTFTVTGKSFTIDIIPATGMVKCTEN